MKRILLVPSAGISPVDQLPPENTLYRCQAALELWRTGWYDFILVTGGIFLPPHTQTRPAADIMRDWFVAQGVSKRKVLVENASLDTFENSGLALHVLTQLRFGRPDITVVTQWQHALRFWITFFFGYRLSVKLHFLAYPLSWREHVHELVSFVYHLADPRGIRGPARKKRAERLRARSNVD